MSSSSFIGEKSRCRFFMFIVLVNGVYLLSGCGKEKENKYNSVLGSWLLKSKLVHNGKDLTKEMWGIWDALSYDFKPNGIVVISGGAEPLEPTEYRYHLVGDSTLHIYRNYRGLTLDDHYSITSVTPDTIWLSCNASYLVYPDSVCEVSSGTIEFLERIK